MANTQPHMTRHPNPSPDSRRLGAGVSNGVFACRITEADMVAAFGPEQPDEVRVGQKWMNATDGGVLPVKRVREDFIDLGSDSYTLVLTPLTLRGEWVCIDSPDNVRAMTAYNSRRLGSARGRA